MSDGGYFSMFSNLVEKYGLVPKSSMNETFQSEYSQDMNDVINEHLHACASFIFNHRKTTKKHLLQIKEKTMCQIYNILVKFLGTPPKTFSWAYINEEGESNVIANLTPQLFKNLVIPSVDVTDYVILSNSETIPYKQLYEIKFTNNVYEGKNEIFVNLPMNELVKYSMKSVLSRMPVWFASDVGKNFDPIHSVLDNKLFNENLVFGETLPFSREDRIKFKNLQGSHAMTLIGVNVNESGNVDSWQVENSWGYYDNETPGEDGFLYMSQSWFENNVVQVCIHKSFLSRSIQNILKQTPKVINPWDSMAPAKIVNRHPHRLWKSKFD